MAKHYAIITFRDAGPLKTWGEVRNAQIHNSREKPIAHAEFAMTPRHVIGTGKLVHDIKAVLRRHKIDPDRLRKNGVIAYEAVLTFSHGAFDTRSPEGAERFRGWYEAQRDFVLAKYGVDRVVSLVCHFDERTVHFHVVIVPLALRVDARSKDPAPRWALVGRTISGPGEYGRVQDEYGRAMEPFGLSRGEVRSGRKHKPVKAYLADLAAQAALNDQRAADLAASLAKVRDDGLRAEVDRREAAKEKRIAIAARRELAEARSGVDAERAALEKDRRLLEKAYGAFEYSRSAAERFLQLVKRFPESTWSPETLLMSRMASGVARGMAVEESDGGALLQQAWMAQQARRGR